MARPYRYDAAGGEHRLECPECGRIVYVDNPLRKYCSTECKATHENRSYYSRNRERVIARVIRARRKKRTQE